MRRHLSRQPEIGLSLDIIGDTVPTVFALSDALPPELRPRFAAGQYREAIARCGANSHRSSLADAELWAHGYGKNADALEVAATESRNLFGVLTRASNATKRSPGMLVTGVARDFENALLALAPENVDSRTLLINVGVARVGGRELREALPHIAPDGERLFLEQLHRCSSGACRPRHVALSTHGPVKPLHHMIAYLDVCGGDMELAIAYRDAGASTLSVVRRLVAAGVPPEYASTMSEMDGTVT